MTKYGFKYGLKAIIWTKYGVKKFEFQRIKPLFHLQNTSNINILFAITNKIHFN
jgi:hypothetical protein